MRMSEKCRNNNSDNPLTFRRTDGGKNVEQFETKWQVVTLEDATYFNSLIRSTNQSELEGKECALT